MYTEDHFLSGNRELCYTIDFEKVLDKSSIIYNHGFFQSTTNLITTPDGYIFQIAVPGTSKDELKITKRCNGKVLEIEKTKTKEPIDLDKYIYLGLPYEFAWNIQILFFNKTNVDKEIRSISFKAGIISIEIACRKKEQEIEIISLD